MKNKFQRFLDTYEDNLIDWIVLMICDFLQEIIFHVILFEGCLYKLSIWYSSLLVSVLVSFLSGLDLLTILIQGFLSFCVYLPLYSQYGIWVSLFIRCFITSVAWIIYTRWQFRRSLHHHDSDVITKSP